MIRTLRTTLSCETKPIWSWGGSQGSGGSDLARGLSCETNPFSGQAIRRTSAVWEKSYGQSAVGRASEKRSQFPRGRPGSGTRQGCQGHRWAVCTNKANCRTAISGPAPAAASAVPSVETSYTNEANCSVAAERANPLQKKSYDESDVRRPSAKQSQFHTGGTPVILGPHARSIAFGNPLMGRMPMLLALSLGQTKPIPGIWPRHRLAVGPSLSGCRIDGPWTESLPSLWAKGENG